MNNDNSETEVRLSPVDKPISQKKTGPPGAKPPGSRGGTPKRKPQKSGTNWLLVGGCSIGILATCGLVFLGLIYAISSGMIGAGASRLAQATPTENEVPTETPIPPTDELPTATYTSTPVPPTSTPVPPTFTPTDEPEDDWALLLTPGITLGNPNLYASDPYEFVAASGEPQLVELFAFW